MPEVGGSSPPRSTEKNVGKPYGRGLSDVLLLFGLLRSPPALVGRPWLHNGYTANVDGGRNAEGRWFESSTAHFVGLAD